MRFDRLDLNLLVALDVLVAERSVTSAAKTLNLSQPATTAALNRLRDFFDDELLVKEGRSMRLTPRAEQLSEPISKALQLIRSEITQPGKFDPATSRRHFVIVASDYAFSIFLANFLARISVVAPAATFEIIPPSTEAMRRFARLEVDAVVGVRNFALQAHPIETLYYDEDVVISWEGADYPDVIDEDAYLEAAHVRIVFGIDRTMAVSEWHFEQMECSRRIELSVSSFVSLVQSVIGSRRLATVHRRLAEHFRQFYPIRIHPCPVELPLIEQIVQWNKLRSRDPGVTWLIAQLIEDGGRLARIESLSMPSGS